MKLIGITGSPRNGTSMTMQEFALALGENRIIFSKQPTPEALNAIRQFKCTEAEKAYLDWESNISGTEKVRMHAKDMNPRGFYEGWPCGGVSWGLGNYHLIDNFP